LNIAEGIFLTLMYLGSMFIFLSLDLLLGLGLVGLSLNSRDSSVNASIGLNFFITYYSLPSFDIFYFMPDKIEAIKLYIKARLGL
jgi:hypothetical protein